MMKRWLNFIACLLLLSLMGSLPSCSKDKEIVCKVSSHEVPTLNRTFRMRYDEEDRLVRIDEFENSIISHQNRLMYNEEGQFVMEERWLVGTSSGPFLINRGELTYDAAGRLSTMAFFSEDLTGELVLQQSIAFNYNNGQLSTIEYERQNSFLRTRVEVLEYVDGNITKSRTKTFSIFPDTTLLDDREMQFDYDDFEQLRYLPFNTLAFPDGNHWPLFSKNNVILTQTTRFDQDGEVMSIDSRRRDLNYDEDNKVIGSLTDIEEIFEYECVEK